MVKVVKNEAFDMFWNFKVSVENKSDEYITFLRIDKGGEFTSTKF